MKIISKILLGTVILALGACGSSSSDNTSSFAGTWNYSSGQLLVTYTGEAAQPSSVTGNLVLSRGVSSDILYTGSGCNFNFAVRGAIASLIPGAACVQTATDTDTGNPYTFTLSPSAWTLQLNGTVLNENGSGTCTAVESGVTATCTFSESATLAKIGQ